MKHYTLRKKINKKNRIKTRTKMHRRKSSRRKRGGGDFVEPIKTYINIVKGCEKRFYEPSEDKVGEINRSLLSLGIPVATNITEKPELIKYYGDALSEYIEDKREIFFDVVDKLVLDNKIPNSEFPKQNIVPTLCCMSLLEKMKAINRMASESFKEHFNPTIRNRKYSRELPYVMIDKAFLENLKKNPNPQDTRILEVFLDNYLINKPIVVNTKEPYALEKYIDDLIQIFNARGSYNRIDETVLGVLNTKIKNINEEKKQIELLRENERKKKEELEKQYALERQNKRQHLYRIIEGVVETGGLFGDARSTLKHFSVDEKKLIIKRLSPNIGSILQEEDVDIDNLLIDILDNNFKEREKYKKTQPKMDAVRDRNGSLWTVIYSLLPGTENGKKIIGRKMYQSKMNSEVRDTLP
jgi:hypothetical protein